MADLINFSFEFFYEIFTQNASLLRLYHGAKKSKMTKNSHQGGPALKIGFKISSTCKIWCSEIGSLTSLDAPVPCLC